MISVGWVVSAFQRSAAAMERIDEIFEVPPEIQTHWSTPGVAPDRVHARHLRVAGR